MDNAQYWATIAREYANAKKEIESSDSHWKTITYKSGKSQLAYLRVLKGGLMSGRSYAIYRGLFIPRRLTYAEFAHIKSITDR